MQSNTSELDDAALLQRYIASGDGDALGTLLSRHSAAAYGVARRYFAQPGDAEDAVQSAFIRLMRLAAGYRGEGSVKGWILGFVVSACRTTIREKTRRAQREERVAAECLRAAPDDAPARELREMLTHALDRLPEHERLPVWLHYYEGLTSREVGAALHTSESTVRSQLNRGLDRLKTVLGGAGYAVALSELPAVLASLSAEAPSSALTQAIAHLALTQNAGLSAGKAVAGKAMLATKTHAVVKAVAVLTLLSATAAVVVATTRKSVAQPATTPAASSPVEGDLAKLPLNCWVHLKPSRLELPAGSGLDPSGSCSFVVVCKLIYDPSARQMLFCSMWQDPPHGSWGQYCNAIFSFNPVSSTLQPLKVANWTASTGRYSPMPSNSADPTPCPRDLYQGFAYAPDLGAAFWCNGVNNHAWIDGQLVDAASSTWRLDLATKRWSQISSGPQPPNRPEAALTYCSAFKCLVLTLFKAERQELWILNLDSGQWRQAKQAPPTPGSGQTVTYDPVRKRVLLGGGGWPGQDGTASSFRHFYAFDLATETISKLADSPTSQCGAPLAYDSKRDLFVLAVGQNPEGIPAGTFCYDPRKDHWREIKTTNPVPVDAARSGFRGLPLCYDAAHDCFIALAVYGQWHALRLQP